MKAKQIRWLCPHCGSGVNGPQRPRKDDVRRYCLKCSATTGRLVERTAPTLERQREMRSIQSGEKRKQKARRTKEAETAYYTVAGVDLRKEMRRLVRLKVFGGPTGRMARRPPTLEVGNRNSYPRSRLGFATPWENKIRVLRYPGIDAADIRETLLHELVHIYIGYDRNDSRWHGDKFHQTMREAFREAYGLTPRGAQTNSYHGRYARALREKEVCRAA